MAFLRQTHRLQVHLRQPNLFNRAVNAAFSTSAEKPLPKAGSLGPRPGDLVPALAALIPQAPVNKNKPASDTPWVKSAESFFSTWKKLAPCMPQYMEFLACHKTGDAELLRGGFVHDLKLVSRQQGGKVASDEVVAALGKFYLSVALQMRPLEVEEAGTDKDALLKLAQKCAEEDFEPFVDAARELVSDYDPKLHKALEDTSPWYEVDDGLFWQANFDAVAPAALGHFLTAVGHGSGQGHVDGKAHTSRKEVAREVEAVRQGLAGEDPAFEPARRAAEVVYAKWFEASSMPVKADIKKILSEHGLLVTLSVHDSPLMPEPISATL